MGLPEEVAKLLLRRPERRWPTGDTDEEKEKQSKGTGAGASECGEMREAPQARGFPEFPALLCSALLSFSPFLSVARVAPGCFQGNRSRRPRERPPTRPSRAAMSPAPHWCLERGGTWREVWERSLMGGVEAGLNGRGGVGVWGGRVPMERG